MLIKPHAVIEQLYKHSIHVQGVLHIGAHECEELPFYESIGIDKTNMIWIDAVQDKVNLMASRNIPNVFKAVVTDKDDDTVTFRLTNNVQSSSVLDFGTHAKHHASVHFVGETKETTVTVDTFMERNKLDARKYDFWNFDIQGAELMALRGATKSLRYVKALYLEVNTEEVYKGCGLMSEIDTFLGERGFNRVLTHMTSCGWGDAVYVRVRPDTTVDADANAVVAVTTEAAEATEAAVATVATEVAVATVATEADAAVADAAVATEVIAITKIPSLSLCIPTMNRWSFLEQNIPKYLENPYIQELVISDETGEDAAKIREKFSDPKLKIFVNSERLGAFRNKEEAVRRATNEWVALIDSDNFAPVSYFEKWVQYIQLNPIQSSIIYAPSRTIPTENHEGFDYRSFIGKELTKNTYKTLTSNKWMECVINTGNYIINRSYYLSSSESPYSSMFAKVNAWEAKMRTWLLLHKGGTFVFPAGFEYYHTVHPGSLYTNNTSEISSYQNTFNALYVSLGSS